MRDMGRAKGTGTIVPTTNRQGQPRFRVAVTMPDGKRVWRTARTQREAERVRASLVEMRELDLDPTRQTLAGFLRGWISSMEGATHQRIRPRTLDFYAVIVERHIIPTLGNLKLSAVTARRVQAWIDADPAAPRTVRHHHAVLRRALNIAVRQRLLAYNPALAVELPRVTTDRADPLTVEEARALIEATRNDRLGPLWALALATGMREGELLGLAWEDVDLGEDHRDGHGLRHDVQQAPTDVGLSGPRHRGQSASVTVRAQLQRRNGAWSLTSTKAARKVKRVSIDPDTAADLEAHRRRMAAERQPSWEFYGLVFVTPEGQPYQRKQVLRAFHAACAKTEMEHHPDAEGEHTDKCKYLRPRRVHDLRHSNLHILADVGVAEDVRMNRAGHSTTAMSRRYSGASEDQDRAAAVAIGRTLRGVG